MHPATPVDPWRPAYGSFGELLADTAVDPDRPYLVELDHDRGSRREWTRGQWRDRVAEIAAMLAGQGVGAGDAVGVLAANSADALAVAFTCWTHGWTYLPLNVHESDERNAFILRDAGARLLLHTPAEADRATRLGATTSLPTRSTDDLHTDRRLEADRPVPLDTPALRVYTSGTTGEPKGVELTAANLLTDCDSLHRVSGWTGDTRVLVVLPIHHVNGLVVSCLQAWYAGGTAVLVDRFRSDRFWQDVDEEQATVCSMVPTLLEFLLGDRDATAPACFREVYCGAGPLMTETVTDFEDRFDRPVRHLYGLSETTAVCTMMPLLPEEQRRSWYADHGFPSIGPAVPHVEVEVHGADDAALPAGERGEIVVRGATVMSGYAGRPEATATVMREGWFHSGDEGFWLPAADGTPYFFVTGRIKELIIRGGVNISPFQVDEVLNAHPAVRFGLAVPFPNRYYGEEIAAYVVPEAEVTEQEILDFCARRLDFAFRPKVVLFGDDVPFTATGKAKRLSLKQELAGRLEGYWDVQFRRSHDDTTPRSQSQEEVLDGQR